ncbi:hypothetical protein [Bradyrhizobium sp. 195]|uniref:hypothetical protein n=1 Tax=Bradyrhizobium sp. 195 TaxID=2782662 RepID=UPI002000955C|nr:hypothetical protein [Bradyrhizobium sp. 195]UPK26557.1 hypothetical protein IVB26_35850 [Bradyrhizobium sp. 195]
MTQVNSAPMPRTLKHRLDGIEKLEQELVAKAHEMLPDGAVNIVDFFILGATQRTLSQSRGFRTLIETKNFPSATILLRTQIDTAMRINGLTMMGDIEADVQKLLKGERTFDRLMSGTPVGGGKPERLTDAFLKKKLAEEHPWIERPTSCISAFGIYSPRSPTRIRRRVLRCLRSAVLTPSRMRQSITRYATRFPGFLG